jgi:hypothetical protein
MQLIAIFSDYLGRLFTTVKNEYLHTFEFKMADTLQNNQERIQNFIFYNFRYNIQYIWQYIPVYRVLFIHFFTHLEH